jgi:hypothetical protein
VVVLVGSGWGTTSLSIIGGEITEMVNQLNTNLSIGGSAVLNMSKTFVLQI